MDEIRERVRQTILRSLMLEDAPPQLGDEDSLRAALGIDSMGFFQIFMALEEEFQIEIQGASITRQTTGNIHQLAELVMNSPRTSKGKR